ncbi:type II secretion system minor pseudopilin GspK [Massilia sp. ST3]|uniref:type II secretion system minor pseudopilin GspK n=1 Tax=Massilia sp. ST3 TaxID=2824903 RepID=UPI001B8319A4|nr:type II secretion system minor pseudopilin GspK [Massilia sp. ST3]MBQ5950103.1 type II secretion system minor pseudopilin GspK [Massilia sp. ST3]
MRLSHPGRQRGVAVVTALLLTTLAVSIVASLFWQQQVQVRSMENQRLQLQTKWILRGALDWSSVVLRQSNYTGPYTSLDQVWATPLAETRLDQYIERERIEGENFDASLSGNIIDATSRYNLTNLAKDKIVSKEQQFIFNRLLTNLRIDGRLAERAAQLVAAGQSVPVLPEDPNQPPPTPPTPPVTGANPIPGTPMPLLRVDDLMVLPGFTPEVMQKLRPFLTVLPQQTPVNVNTAPAEVLAAVLPGYSLSEANVLVEKRKRAPWRDIEYFKGELKPASQPEDGSIGVQSNYFLVQSRIRLDRAALNAESLISREGIIGGGTKVVWTRQN